MPSRIAQAVERWHGGRIAIVWVTCGAVAAVLLMGQQRLSYLQQDLSTNILRFTVANPFLSLSDADFREAMERHAPVEDRAHWGVYQADSVLSGHGREAIQDRRNLAWNRLERRQSLLSASSLLMLLMVAGVCPVAPLAITWIWLGRNNSDPESARAP